MSVVTIVALCLFTSKRRKSPTILISIVEDMLGGGEAHLTPILLSNIIENRYSSIAKYYDDNTKRIHKIVMTNLKSKLHILLIH